MNTPSPDCLHQTRTVVIIDIFVEDPCCNAHYYCSMKYFLSFVGPPFCGAPVWLNMLNMPKSASEHISFSNHTQMLFCCCLAIVVLEVTLYLGHYK